MSFIFINIGKFNPFVFNFKTILHWVKKYAKFLAFIQHIYWLVMILLVNSPFFDFIDFLLEKIRIYSLINYSTG